MSMSPFHSNFILCYVSRTSYRCHRISMVVFVFRAENPVFAPTPHAYNVMHTFKTNQRTDSVCIYWLYASVWVNGASFILAYSFRTLFLSIAGHSERDKQQKTRKKRESEQDCCGAGSLQFKFSFSYPFLHNVLSETFYYSNCYFLTHA